MNAEIVTIGDELCRGEITDTNASWLAARLWDLDIPVAWMTSCRDLADDIAAAVTAAAGRADVVLATGGLGPTEDDLTVDVVAALAGVAPEIEPAALARMTERFERVGYRLTENNRRQVRIPAAARVLGNPAGLAPAFEVAVAGTPIICMPGVPGELHSIYEEALESRLLELRGDGGERLAKRTFRVFGMGESHIAAALEGVANGVDGATLHYQVKYPETLVKLVVRDPDAAVALSRLEAVAPEFHARLGDKLYGTGAESLSLVLGRQLRSLGATVAVAESCTGGLIGSLLAEPPGASDYFSGGVVTYCNEAKERQLGVDPAVLAADGAVSRACAEQMARGVRERFGCDFAVSSTGIAGPGGGTAEKPVGTVWLVAVGPGDREDDAVQERKLTWPGGRGQVRQLAAHTALALLLRLARGRTQ